MAQRSVLVVGGAGYVGTVLCRRLAESGVKVFVLDTFWFGDHLGDHPNIVKITGDVREPPWIPVPTDGGPVPDVIYLACLSNDPSCDLDPALAQEVNYDAFVPFAEKAKEYGVRRFIYASSSSVYGIHRGGLVTEKVECHPLTQYSELKLKCENHLLKMGTKDFSPIVVRPATVCGVSPRMRYDLVVNMLVRQALETRTITLFGKDNERPLIHIRDMVGAYIRLLEAPLTDIAGQVFNIGSVNWSLWQIGLAVRRWTSCEIKVDSRKADARSYRIDSTKAREVFGYQPLYGVDFAILDIKDAIQKGTLPLALEYSHINLKQMQALRIKPWG